MMLFMRDWKRSLTSSTYSAMAWLIDHSSISAKLVAPPKGGSGIAISIPHISHFSSAARVAWYSFLASDTDFGNGNPLRLAIEIILALIGAESPLALPRLWNAAITSEGLRIGKLR